MANQEHIEIIKQGIDKWNQWRVENPDIEPDLSEYSFTNKIIKNEPQINLKGANLKKANLAWSRLRLADLRNANLSEANLQQSNLSGAFLMQANLNGVNLSGANLQGANLSEATINAATLRSANLSPGGFMGHEFFFEKTIFQLPRWRRGSYFFEQIRKTILRKATICKADLSGADFSNVDLMGSNLSDSKLHATMLKSADLRSVDFEGASLYEANLNLANLENANFRRSKFKSTYFLSVDLSKVNGLNEVRHDGPSTISLDTLWRSGGNIPGSFLKDVGAPDAFIEFYQSYSSNANDYLSCFISFSESDQEFAKKLHLDLKYAGLRAWLVPDETKIGKLILPRVYQGYPPNEKLIIVFSNSSVNSDWIEAEINQTLEHERKISEDLGIDEQSIPILLPIMIDSSIIEAKQTWAKNIRKERHIENFTEWENSTSYRTVLDRLIKVLKNT